MKQENGFAIILVLIMSSGLLATSLAVWHQTSLLYDLLRERNYTYEHKVKAHQFFKATISMIKKYSNIFMKLDTKKDMPIMLSIFPINQDTNKDEYSATLLITKKQDNNILGMNLTLFKNKLSVYKIEWICIPKKINGQNILEVQVLPSQK